MSVAPSRELDHFVVHIDDDPGLLRALQKQLAAIDIPFEPDWGKGTTGFKASNIWVGRQYFEIIRILRPDGGGWVERWVKRHHEGERGLYCLFLKTDRLDALAAQLRTAGIAIADPERVTYRAFFGLFKKTMPWRMVYLPPIPGVDLELAFIEYDPDPKDVLKAHMTPNADENGVTGVRNARLRLPLTHEARGFLRRVFPDATGTDDVLAAPLEHGSIRFENADALHADLYAKQEKTGAGASAVTLENVTLHV